MKGYAFRIELHLLAVSSLLSSQCDPVPLISILTTTVLQGLPTSLRGRAMVPYHAPQTLNNKTFPFPF